MKRKPFISSIIWYVFFFFLQNMIDHEDLFSWWKNFVHVTSLGVTGWLGILTVWLVIAHQISTADVNRLAFKDNFKKLINM